jgi:hypothetical protein
MALGVAVVLLLVWAPVASADAPVNDNFEDAQGLVGALPIDVSTTNVEATKEEGEPLHGTFGSKGHSVWFEWEATATGFVTAGTCGSDFATVLSVYTGTEVDELTKVAGDFDSQGPGCPSFNGQEITFEAINGTSYWIAVDGDPFYVPPAEPPAGEGAIELQLKVTPTPVNDDFADATALTGLLEEEEGAETAFYWASARGFNWNATKEAGEADHAGDPGGASVWYSWTAPRSGSAAAGVCEGKPVVVGVYTGVSLGALFPVGAYDFFSCRTTFSASAGTTYWIVVDGKFDTEAGSAALGSFGISVSMQLPAQVRTQPAPDVLAATSPDTTPPSTTIRKRVLKRMPPIWIFSFGSDEPGSSFQCKLDKRPFKKCRSSKTFKRLKPGGHTFKVRAVDSSGNVDKSPAVARFTVPGKAPAKR